MKQIELDDTIAGWFGARDAADTAEAESNRMRTAFERKTQELAKQLLPANSNPRDRWIFPSTGGRMVVAYLKEQKSYPQNGGEPLIRHEPTVEEHKR